LSSSQGPVVEFGATELLDYTGAVCSTCTNVGRHSQQHSRHVTRQVCIFDLHIMWTELLGVVSIEKMAGKFFYMAKSNKCYSVQFCNKILFLKCQKFQICSWTYIDFGVCRKLLHLLYF